MDANTNIKFIEKTIEKTKKHELNWLSLSSDFVIKSLPGEEDQNILNVFNTTPLMREYSYLAKYKTGQLLILVKRHLAVLPALPPDNCELSLRIQDDKSNFPIEIANSSYGQDSSTALIRLYNLIDKDVSSLNSLIQDFLNS